MRLVICISILAIENIILWFRKNAKSMSNSRFSIPQIIDYGYSHENKNKERNFARLYF